MHLFCDAAGIHVLRVVAGGHEELLDALARLQDLLLVLAHHADDGRMRRMH